MKATDVIRRDHEAAKLLFNQVRDATPDELDEIEKKLFDALTAHERMEDQYFYPALKESLKDEDFFSELELEQKELEAATLAARALPGDKQERILKMSEAVLAHAEKEEATVLKRAEEIFTADKLEELGAEMEPESAVAKSEAES